LFLAHPLALLALGLFCVLGQRLQQTAQVGGHLYLLATPVAVVDRFLCLLAHRLLLRVGILLFTADSVTPMAAKSSLQEATLPLSVEHLRSLAEMEQLLVHM
jgi:hypothetical protein